MSGVRFVVAGVPQVARSLDAIGRECEDSDALGPIADATARLIAANAPRLSGRLAGSFEGSVIGGRAVAESRGSIRYAGVQNYGWPARGIVGRHFIERAEAPAAALAVRQLEQAINDEIRKQGMR